MLHDRTGDEGGGAGPNHLGRLTHSPRHLAVVHPPHLTSTTRLRRLCATPIRPVAQILQKPAGVFSSARVLPACYPTSLFSHMKTTPVPSTHVHFNRANTTRSRGVHFAIRWLHQAPPPRVDSAEVPGAGPGLLPVGAGPPAPGHQHPELPRDLGPGGAAHGARVHGGRGVG